MVSVGIEGSRVTSGPALTAALTQIGIPAGQVQAAELTALAHPTWFVPVTQLSEAAYEQFKPVIYPVPGTVFNMYSARGALTPSWPPTLSAPLGPSPPKNLRRWDRLTRRETWWARAESNRPTSASWLAPRGRL